MKLKRLIDPSRFIQRFYRSKAGAPKSGYGASAWDAAGNGKRLRYWQPESAAINPLLRQHLESLRQRSRDMVRNNPYAANILETLVSNVIGTGIKPQPKAEETGFRQALQALWQQWTAEADHDGMSDFYGLQARVCRSMIESGECLVRYQVRSKKAGLSVPLQLQVLEGDHLDISQDRALARGGHIRGGIEFDASGQRTAYYLYRTHPGDSGMHAIGGDSRQGQPVRIPASEVLHIYRMDRPGQVRGEPWLSRVLLKLHELDQYDDAELVRKKTAAMFAGFITRLDPESALLGESETNPQGVATAGLEPGTLQLLDAGEDIRFSEPSDVGGNYLDFMRQQLRAIAAGMGITYEQLSGDLTEVNYSSIRAGLIEFRRRCAMLQHHIMVFQFCRPVWKRWLELAFISHALTLPENTTRYQSVKWIPQGFDWVDPLKDQQAQRLAVRSGFKSRSQVVSELGHDIESVDHDSYIDHERAAKWHLPFDSHVRYNFDELKARQQRQGGLP